MCVTGPRRLREVDPAPSVKRTTPAPQQLHDRGRVRSCWRQWTKTRGGRVTGLVWAGLVVGLSREQEMQGLACGHGNFAVQTLLDAKPVGCFGDAVLELSSPGLSSLRSPPFPSSAPGCAFWRVGQRNLGEGHNFRIPAGGVWLYFAFVGIDRTKPDPPRGLGHLHGKSPRVRFRCDVSTGRALGRTGSACDIG